MEWPQLLESWITPEIARRDRRERDDLLSMFLGEAASGEATATGRER